MRKVDLKLATMSSPKYCCRCGSECSELKTFSEHIALRAMTPLEVSVQVPVCNSCVRRKPFFYVAAIVALGLSLVGFKFAAPGSWQALCMVALFLLAAGLYVIAVKSTPIKILDYHPSTDTISLGCLHPGFAANLAALSNGVDTKYVRVRKSFLILALLTLVALVVAAVLGV